MLGEHLDMLGEYLDVLGEHLVVLGEHRDMLYEHLHNGLHKHLDDAKVMSQHEMCRQPWTLLVLFQQLHLFRHLINLDSDNLFSQQRHSQFFLSIDTQFNLGFPYE